MEDEKKPIAIQYCFTVKEIRKCVALLTGDILTTDEINKTYFDREVVKCDLSKILDEDEMLRLCIALVSSLIAIDESKNKPKRKTFKERLDEEMERNPQK